MDTITIWHWLIALGIVLAILALKKRWRCDPMDCA